MSEESLRQRKVTGLGLKTTSPAKKLSILHKLHFLTFIILPQLLFVIPLTIIYKHLINRNSRVVAQLGRKWYSDFMVRISNIVMEHASPQQIRMIVNRTISYEMNLGGIPKGWATKVEFNGMTGRMLAPPNTKRSDDEVVLYFIHGGGFVIDSGGSACVFWGQLLKEMNHKRKIQFSIFLLDYELAPETYYPSQLIESLAGYSYLVNILGVSTSKICLSGDSAGGNLVAGLALHIARPNPVIKVPSVFGPCPSLPASIALVSPHSDLFTKAPSTLENQDCDCLGVGVGGMGNFAALNYMGVQCDEKPGTAPNHVPSFNPILIVSGGSPYPRRVNVPLSKKVYEFDGIGLELASSPYLNPILAEESWLLEAFGSSRNLVVYGGAEILRDSVRGFIAKITKAGVNPIEEVVRPYGMHDWIFFDFVIPGLWKSSTYSGKSSQKNYGLHSFADFLQEGDLIARREFWENKE